jgi:hypothetical protein
MDSEPTNNINMYQTNSTKSVYDYESKDYIILLLIVVLVLSILGINLFYLLGYLIQYIAYLFKPLLSIIGYTSGSIINTTADLAADTSHFGIDVAEGTVQDVGNLLLAASDKKDIPTLPPAIKTYPTAIINAIGKTLDIQQIKPSPINMPNTIYSPLFSPSPSPSPKIVTPSSDTTESPIQNPISTNKNQWCLIGEYQHRNGCIQVDDSTKCMSGQVFPNQQMCLNPTLTTNIVPPNNKAELSGYYTQNGVMLPKIMYNP